MGRAGPSRTTVLSEDGDGWAKQVEFDLNAGAIKNQYVLEYDWDVDEDGTGTVRWNLVRALYRPLASAAWSRAR